MAFAQECRFSDEPATTSQKKNWNKIVSDYGRMSTVHQFRMFRADTLAKTVGLSSRQTETLLAKVKQPGFDPRVDLAKDVLAWDGLQGTRRGTGNSA